MIQEVLKLPCSITKAFRIGKKAEKPCLLKVSVQSLKEKTQILRNKQTELKDPSNSEKLGNVYITPDLTPERREVNS